MLDVATRNAAISRSTSQQKRLMNKTFASTLNFDNDYAFNKPAQTSRQMETRNKHGLVSSLDPPNNARYPNATFDYKKLDLVGSTKRFEENWQSGIFNEWGTGGNNSARALSKPGDAHPLDHEIMKQTTKKEDAGNYQAKALLDQSLFRKPLGMSTKDKVAMMKTNSAKEHMKFFHGKRAESMN